MDGFPNQAIARLVGGKRFASGVAAILRSIWLKNRFCFARYSGDAGGWHLPRQAYFDPKHQYGEYQHLTDVSLNLAVSRIFRVLPESPLMGARIYKSGAISS